MHSRRSRYCATFSARRHPCARVSRYNAVSVLLPVFGLPLASLVAGLGPWRHYRRAFRTPHATRASFTDRGCPPVSSDGRNAPALFAAPPPVPLSTLPPLLHGIGSRAAMDWASFPNSRSRRFWRGSAPTAISLPDSLWGYTPLSTISASMGGPGPPSLSGTTRLAISRSAWGLFQAPSFPAVFSRRAGLGQKPRRLGSLHAFRRGISGVLPSSLYALSRLAFYGRGLDCLSLFSAFPSLVLSSAGRLPLLRGAIRFPIAERPFVSSCPP